jgi:fatty acid desaturase
LRNTRTTHAGFLERLFIAPYYVNYHLEHHLLFYVPCYNLPRLHRMLLAKGFGPKMEIQPDYLTMMKRAVSKPEPATPMAVAA